MVFQFVICTTKLGICAFYLRLFRDKWSRWFLYALLAIVAALSLSMELTIIFSCKPISDAWSLGKRNCIPFPPTFIANTCCNIAVDLALMAFVLPKMSKFVQRSQEKEGREGRELMSRRRTSQTSTLAENLHLCCRQFGISRHHCRHPATHIDSQVYQEQ